MAAHTGELEARIAALELGLARLASLVGALTSIVLEPELIEIEAKSDDAALLIAEADQIARDARAAAHIPEGGDVPPESF